MATFLIFAIDKAKAIMGQWRIREALLLGLSLIGGALGGWLAMDLCKHKVQTEYFMAGLPLMMAAHALILLYAAIGMV